MPSFTCTLRSAVMWSHMWSTGPHRRPYFRRNDKTVVRSIILYHSHTASLQYCFDGTYCTLNPPASETTPASTSPRLFLRAHWGCSARAFSSVGCDPLPGRLSLAPPPPRCRPHAVHRTQRAAGRGVLRRDRRAELRAGLPPLHGYGVTTRAHREPPHRTVRVDAPGHRESR